MTRRISLCAGMAAIALLAAAPAGAASLSIDFVRKFVASDGTGGEDFGTSVALSGTMALIGAPRDDENGNNSGAAYLIDTDTGAETKITANDGQALDFFGFSTALDGTTALIGAAFSNRDAAYVIDTATGTQTRLTAPGGGTGDFFGFSVALDGSSALVGTPGDDGSGAQSGAAYLFDTGTGTGTRIAASDAAVLDQFGASAALDGSTALIGANLDDDNGLNSGSVYLIDTVTGDETRLLASDGAAGDNFGTSVALSGTTALAGAPGDSEHGASSGSAYLIDTGTGAETKLLAADGAEGDQFGRAVALDGTIAVIGAIGDDEDAANSGSVYVFDTLTGMLIQKIGAPDAAAGNAFGFSVAVSGDLILVGAIGDNGRAGAAYLYRINAVDAAVPLPAPLALLLGGIGALGLVARRRKFHG